MIHSERRKSARRSVKPALLFCRILLLTPATKNGSISLFSRIFTAGASGPLPLREREERLLRLRACSQVSLGSVGHLQGAFEIPKHAELRENRSR
jgi:hypothetical protein